MSMSLFRTADTDHGLFSPATTTRPRWLRQAELAELEHMLRSAIMSTMAEASRPVTVASAHRADGYAAVMFTGHLDGPASRAAGARLRGVLDAGPRTSSSTSPGSTSWTPGCPRCCAGWSPG
jgi:hypothetical protein